MKSVQHFHFLSLSFFIILEKKLSGSNVSRCLKLRELHRLNKIIEAAAIELRTFILFFPASYSIKSFINKNELL